MNPSGNNYKNHHNSTVTAATMIHPPVISSPERSIRQLRQLSTATAAAAATTTSTQTTTSPATTRHHTSNATVGTTRTTESSVLSEAATSIVRNYEKVSHLSSTSASRFPQEEQQQPQQQHQYDIPIDSPSTTRQLLLLKRQDDRKNRSLPSKNGAKFPYHRHSTSPKKKNTNRGSSSDNISFSPNDDDDHDKTGRPSERSSAAAAAAAAVVATGTTTTTAITEGNINATATTNQNHTNSTTSAGVDVTDLTNPTYSSLSSSISNVSSSGGSGKNQTTTSYTEDDDDDDDDRTDDDDADQILQDQYGASTTTVTVDGSNSILLNPHSTRQRRHHQGDPYWNHPSNQYRFNDEDDHASASVLHQLQVAAQCSPCFGTTTVPPNPDPPMIPTIDSHDSTVSGMTHPTPLPTAAAPNSNTVVSDVAGMILTELPPIALCSGNDLTTRHHHLAPTTPMDNTGGHPDKNHQSWWFQQMFQQMEQQHSQERAAWEKELQQSTHQQSQYKSELKQTIQQQLLWLEDRFMAPQHILPGIHATIQKKRQKAMPTPHHLTNGGCGDGGYSTESTTATSSTQGNYNAPFIQYVGDGRQQPEDDNHTMDLTWMDPMGMEMTYDASLQVRRIEELEQCLHDTIDQYQKDREEWIRTLEEAATLTTAGEQMSTQQQEQSITLLQTQMSTCNKKQRKQWKEQTRVLAELLQLTEQQLATEQMEWKKEREEQEVTISQLLADMKDLVMTVETTSRENSEWKQKVLDMEQEKSSVLHHEQQQQMEKKVRFEMEERIDLIRQEIQTQHKQEMDHSIQVLRQESTLQQQQLEKEVEEIQNAATTQKQDMEQEIEKLRNDALQHQLEMEKLQKECDAVRDESRTFRAYAADFTEQATVSKKQCTVLQKNLALAAASSDSHHGGSPNKKQLLNCNKNSVASSASSLADDLDNKLDRAIAERDLYQQETVTLLKERNELQQQVDILQKQYHELQDVHSSWTTTSAEHLFASITDPNGDTNEQQPNDLTTKYKDSIEKHSELVIRLKRIEEQRADDRGKWKMQLESALAETRMLRDEQLVKDRTISELTDQYTVETQGLKVRLQQAVTDRKRQFDELIGLCGDQGGKFTESQLVQHLQERLQEVETEMEHRCQLLVTNHSTEIADYKNQIIGCNQQMQDLEEEMEHRCDQLVENHYIELSELQERFREVENESHDTIAALQQQQQQKSNKLSIATDDDDATTQVVSNTKKRLVEKGLVITSVDDSSGNTLLASTLSENNVLIDRVDELSRSLVEYKRLHHVATKKYERALMDRNGYKDELEAIRRMGDEYTVHQEVAGRLERHQNLFLNAIDELRDDITSVHKSLETSSRSEKATELAKFDALRGDLAHIQISLNDAVAELTLDADAMMQSRDALQTVASDVSETLKETTTKRRLWQQQEQLLKEVTALRQHIKINGDPNVDHINTSAAGDDEDRGRSSSSAHDQDGYILSRELITELQQKETALAIAQTELRHCKEQLESEIASRQISDAEIGTLNDQADVYEEEIAILQSANTKLVKKLRDLGIQLDVSLFAGYLRSNRNSDASNDDCNSAIASPRLRTGRRHDDSLIVLDEALALAEGLTSIVHGHSASGDHEPTAMEMLESMSEMMDVHELRATSQDVSSPTSDQQHKKQSYRKVYDDIQGGGIEVVHEVDDNDDDSSLDWFRNNNNNGISNKMKLTPIVISSSPKKSFSTADEQTAAIDECKLQLVVEQLYGRCQLLERERVEMMEATLDLLESAREANTAQLEAALATARRKSTEEIMRVRDESRQEQERIFHKLCKSYIVQHREKNG